jgi:hypothetical protein
VGDGYQTRMADVESPSATQPFCVWSQTSRNFAIQIPPGVIGSLCTESLVAFKRVPRRGLETGGILLGRTELLGDTTTFWIEGFAPIESEHRFGPSYLLSDSDFAHLQQELTKNAAASLGIYRSQTRSEELAIQDADAGLFEKCFGVSDNLFLMLAPLPRLGAFYFREGGNLKCVHQFTLVSSLSSLATPSRTSSPHVNLHAPPSAGTEGAHANIARHTADPAGALVVANQRSEPEGPPRSVSTVDQRMGKPPSVSTVARRLLAARGSGTTAIRRWAIKLWSDSRGRGSAVKFGSWGLAVFAMAVLTVSLLSYSFRRSAVPVRQAPNYLNLTVERAGPALQLLWDGNSSAIRGATRAVIHIQDGSQQSDRELTPSELRAGQYTYQPQHSAVTFRLNVYAGEPNAIGLIQVMFPPSPITAAPSIEPISQPSQDRRPSAQPPVKPIARAKAPAAESAPTVQSDDKLDHHTGTQLPAVSSLEASKVSPPAALEPSLPAQGSGWHSLNTERKDISPPIRELTVRASTRPVRGSRLGSVFGKIPLVGRLRKQSKAVEAAPVYQPTPIVKMPGDQQLIGPVAVGVKVYVNESGGVNDAEVVDYGEDPLSSTLANAALAAARNWTFAPSRVDDIPVASQLIIQFYFSP